MNWSEHGKRSALASRPCTASDMTSYSCMNCGWQADAPAPAPKGRMSYEDQLAAQRISARYAKEAHPKACIQLWRIDNEGENVRVSIIGNVITPAMLDIWREDRGCTCTLIEEVTL